MSQRHEPSRTAERDRPRMPSGYGVDRAVTGGMLPWNEVEKRLAGSRNYWVVTAGPNGRPHAVPVWGIWAEGAFYFFTDPASKKGRDMAANPEITVHLESGDDVVILEGAVAIVADVGLLERIADAYQAKYGFRPEPRPGDGGYYLAPQTVFAWTERDFPATATRWRFPPDTR